MPRFYHPTVLNDRVLQTFLKRFFDSEKSSGVLILLCTLFSLSIANSFFGETYLDFWRRRILGLSIEHWINDGLMAIFFLFIGLELERELYSGELSDFRNALLPIFAASGGIAIPALIHLGLNAGTQTQNGMGIPMATDIAFALGILALLGTRIPTSLKVFLTALAVIDDLGAIIVIAVFYTSDLKWLYLLAAIGMFALMIIMNRRIRIMSLWTYLVSGAIMWYFMLKSGVHATLAGVLLAFAIPYSAKRDDEESPSHRLEHILHKPVAFIVLPMFALANTGIVIGSGWKDDLTSANSIGILTGLVVGKPIGITLLAFAAVYFGICRLPTDMNWKQIFGAGLLGGIGFTMSIFITNLAFIGGTEIINASKIAILLASLIAGTIGYIWLRVLGGAAPTLAITR
jgi:NhaA family Na+:H+ antiporter